MKHQPPYNIAQLIASHLAQSITPEEAIELKAWREESLEHEALFQKLCNEEYLKERLAQRRAFNPEIGWAQTSKKIQTKARKRVLYRITQLAALIAIPLAIGLLIAHLDFPNGKEVVALVQRKGAAITPGGKKAVLQLGNGEVVDLKSAQNTQLKEKDGTAICISSSNLNYLSQSSPTPTSQKEVYNKLEIPRGGEYALVLSDGTKVHLNAMSSLRFPVQFLGDKRVVELKGEGFFEVSKTGKPFIVKTETTQIEVLGTTFNVSAYRGESYRTTLVTGSVRIKTADKSFLLKPSEQASITAEEADKVIIRQVDTQLYTSWVQGKIYFKDQRLEEIMHTLAKWYDITVNYQDDRLKDLKFGCHVDRYKEITPFLELLERTGKVAIKTHGKTITINYNY